MQMPRRQNVGITNNEEYRFNYNGMEVDNEVSGNGNSYTTEFRQYDPRLGRWKSLDPLMATYPSWSPYNAFENNPIIYDDPSGLGVDDWIEDKTTGEMTWDEDVHSQSDVDTKFNNDPNLVYRAPGHTYDNVYGAKTTLLDDGKFINSPILPQQSLKDIEPEEFSIEQKFDYLKHSISINGYTGGNTASKGNGQKNADGWFLEINIGTFVGGGMKFSYGIVGDMEGNTKQYYTYGGGIGFGASAGVDGGAIIMKNDGVFHVDDWAGKSQGLSAQFGILDFSIGGNDVDGSKGLNMFGDNMTTYGGLPAFVVTQIKSAYTILIKMADTIDVGVSVNYTWNTTKIW